MQSDTPRTDALVDEGGMPYDADFARKLERELAAAIKQRDEARIRVCELCARMGGVYRRVDRKVVECRTPEEIAEVCGWDCFAKKEGGGA